MNTKERLIEMKRQLVMMMDDAIANYDKAIARQDTEEWEEFAYVYGLSIYYLEERLDLATQDIDIMVDNLNEELYMFEEAANAPFDEFV